MTAEQREAQRARSRERRRNQSDEQRDALNARRRERRRNLTGEQRDAQRARDRERQRERYRGTPISFLTLIKHSSSSWIILYSALYYALTIIDGDSRLHRSARASGGSPSSEWRVFHALAGARLAAEPARL